MHMNLFVHLKEKITVRELKLLLICIIIGLLIMCLFSGKTRRDIESMAVSPNEQYIAFFDISALTTDQAKLLIMSGGSLLF